MVTIWLYCSFTMKTMNKLALYLFTIALCTVGMTNLTAQDKRDYYWPFGKDQSADTGIQATEFDFNNKPFEPSLREGGLEFDQNNASICDKEGNLLFYTNGCAVANRNHEVMMNGDSINVGYYFDSWWLGDCGNGYPGRQDITILPDPNYSDGYYLIHKPRFRDMVTKEHSMKNISFSYVDMNLDSGMGGVLEKNIHFYDGELHWSYLTSIAHTNGRDWWIINPAIKENGYLTFLLTETGIELQSVQELGPELDPRYSGAAGSAKFSPDGTMYSLFNHYDGLLLFDFDRESGELSNLRQIPFEWPEAPIVGGCEWSPNSRFLYLTTRDTLWQVDIEEENLEDSRVFIDAYNGINDPLNTSFWFSALGPDCRIYIRPGNGSRSFHVIHKPNEKGIDCDFVQQGIKLPRISATGSFPNFPRFRVDEEEKCDPSITSIAGEAVWWRRDLSVYPSPASEYVTVELPEGKHGKLYILDMQGQMVYNQAEVLYDERIDISDLASGTYSVEFIPEQNKERVVYTKRITVVE